MQRHSHCSCVQASEKHPEFLKPLQTLRTKMSPEAVLCCPERSLGQEILQAQCVSTLFVIPKEKWPACPLRCYGGRGPQEDAYLQKLGNLPVRLSQLYHSVDPVLWVLYESSGSESGRGKGMMENDSFDFKPHNSHSFWMASDTLLAGES